MKFGADTNGKNYLMLPNDFLHYKFVNTPQTIIQLNDLSSFGQFENFSWLYKTVIRRTL